jgi:hypothetical protein
VIFTHIKEVIISNEIINNCRCHFEFEFESTGRFVSLIYINKIVSILYIFSR